jgi:O-succinylbenzoic acid--CoA ligase
MEHWLLRAAAMRPDRPAVGPLSYAELAARARSFAGGLIERGVSPGDRVGLALPAGIQYVAALHGCLLAGAAAVPIDLRLGTEERRDRAAGAELVIEDPPTGQLISDPIPFELDAVALIVHTSGTTSAARPVALTYGNLLASALGSAVALGLDPDERWLCPMPLAHVGGLSIPIRSAIYATTAVIHERFDVDAVLAALSDPCERITLVSLVPTMLARLLDAGLQNPPALRWVLLGGAPIPESLLERAAMAGVPVAPTYGMTEACSQIATFGWPLAGVELRIAEEEILVRGAIVAPGALADDGWLHTGDLGSFDERGRLRISSRRVDTIITGGENVAPQEVEDVLLAHPAVADAAVHGRPDREWGEAIVATVVLRDGVGAAPAELQAHCAARLARFKVPKDVVFADGLPRTASGKLLRRQLS